MHMTHVLPTSPHNPHRTSPESQGHLHARQNQGSKAPTVANTPRAISNARRCPLRASLRGFPTYLAHNSGSCLYRFSGCLSDAIAHCEQRARPETRQKKGLSGFDGFDCLYSARTPAFPPNRKLISCCTSQVPPGTLGISSSSRFQRCQGQEITPKG